jgi:hypothetical protein
MDINEAKTLKSNMHATFDSEHGKEVMKFIEKIGNWYPSINDSMETNNIVARDATRRLIATIKTILKLSPEQIEILTKEQ